MITHTTAPMSDKEALHLLYTLSRKAVSDQSSEQFQQVWNAYLLLVQAVYGPRQQHQLSFPCDLCRERYAEDPLWVEELSPEAAALFASLLGMSALRVVWCCAPCLQRWKASLPPAAESDEVQSIENSSVVPSFQHQEELSA